MWTASKPVGRAIADVQVALVGAEPPHAPLAGPTSSSPGGTSAVLPAVDGSDSSTYAGIVKLPLLAGAMHSTRIPGVLAAGSMPDASVEAMAVMSTKPLGSPPVQSISKF